MEAALLGKPSRSTSRLIRSFQGLCQFREILAKMLDRARFSPAKGEVERARFHRLGRL